MCAVSVLYDYARLNVPTTDWTRPLFTDFQEIIRRLDALDVALKQPDCHDPAKAAWMREVEERLSKLEADAP